MNAAHSKDVPPVYSKPQFLTTWQDDTPRLAVDKNDIAIVLHIPRWQRGDSPVSDGVPSKVSFSDFEKSIFKNICEELARSVPPVIGKGADKSCRDLPGIYHMAEGEDSGRITLVCCWHAICHTVSSPSC